MAGRPKTRAKRAQAANTAPTTTDTTTNTTPTTTPTTNTTNGPARSGAGTRARGGPRKVTDAERRRMRDRAAEGASVRDIAVEFGRSTATVSGVCSDLMADRRERTAAASETRSVQAAEKRQVLLDRLLDASSAGLARWARVDRTDHQGAAHEARSVTALVSAFSRLDERHARAQGTGGQSEVDVFLRHLAGEGVPDEYLPDEGDDAVPE